MEALLVAQEDVIERFRKVELGTVQANVAQGAVQEQKDELQPIGRGNGGRRGRGRGFRGGRSWNNGTRPQCQLCGKFGHTVWQCYFRFDHNFQNPLQSASNPPPPPSATFHNPAQIAPLSHNPRAYIAAPGSVADTSWYPDSGATHHLTFDQRNLITGSEYEGPEQVFIGNGQGMDIAHIGKSCLVSKPSKSVRVAEHAPLSLRGDIGKQSVS